YVGELAPGSFTEPFGVIGDIDGNIIVADRSRNTVQLFDWSGQAIASPFGRCSGDPLAFIQPWRLTLQPGTRFTPGQETGQILIVDGGDNRVIVCSATMTFLANFG